MSKDEYLITDAPLKALTVFAMPMILGSFFQQVYNMACLLYTSEEACKRAKVSYTVSARTKMVHCYCMLPIFKEACEDFKKITDILKK